MLANNHPGSYYAFGGDYAFIELTNRCNMKCKFCPSEVTTRERCDLPESSIEKFFLLLSRLKKKPKAVLFNVLGEPLLSRNIHFALDQCAKHGMRPIVITNFLLMNRERLHRIYEANADTVLVLSLQSLDGERFKTLRGIDFQLEKYVARLYELLDEKYRINNDARIEIHLATVLGQAEEDRRLARSLFGQEQTDELARSCGGFLQELEAYAARTRDADPEAWAAQWSRALATWREELGSGRISASPRTPPSEYWKIPEQEYWGHMFMPNVFFRMKAFGLWTKEKRFLDRLYAPFNEGFVFLEEAGEDITCDILSHTVLSDGRMTTCCLDYDGENAFGSIDALALDDLRPQAFRPGEHALCRRCKGRLHSFPDQGRAAANREEVTQFGLGWHGYETVSNLRWSTDQASCFLYPAANRSQLAFEARSLVEDNPLELAVFEHRDGEFRPVTVLTATVGLPFKGYSFDLPLSKKTLYKITVRCRADSPERLGYGPDPRTLGIAVRDVHVSSRKGWWIFR